MPDVPLPPLDPDKIREAKGEGEIGQRVLIFHKTSSTNKLLLQLGESGEPNGTVIFAESQTAGRGRFRRPWHSAPGLGLWFSVLVRPQFSAPEMELLTLFAAVATTEAIRLLCPCDVCIKPPNDLYIASKKVAGILIETRIGQNSFAVIGIGLNVNHRLEDFPDSLKDSATSLAIESANNQNRQQLAQAILQRLNYWYPKLLEASRDIYSCYKELRCSAFQDSEV